MKSNTFPKDVLFFVLPLDKSGLNGPGLATRSVAVFDEMNDPFNNIMAFRNLLLFVVLSLASCTFIVTSRAATPAPWFNSDVHELASIIQAIIVPTQGHSTTWVSHHN